MPLSRAFSLLSKRVQEVAEESGLRLATPPQEEAIPFVIKGEHVLIIAPTGTGKTEAAILPLFSRLSQRRRKGISILYITPLRALNRDMLRRLLSWSRRLGFRVEVRHGDTAQSERRRQSVKPPDILITTPETLQAVLAGRRMRVHLKNVRHVVVDELHQLAQDRRGVQLSVGLERLEKLVGREFQRIGLSATIGSPDEAARLLAGERRVRIIRTREAKSVRYFVELPYPGEEDYTLAQGLFTSPEAAARINRICELIDNYHSTLIFVNSRTNAEMLGSRLSMIRKDVAVHHGSLPREERRRLRWTSRLGCSRPWYAPQHSSLA